MLDLLEAEKVGADAVLEDQDKQPVRRADREQVEDNGGRRRGPPSGRRA